MIQDDRQNVLTFESYFYEERVRPQWMSFCAHLPRRLYRDFFESRLRSEGCHIKAFAGECISAVLVMVQFCKQRLDPYNLLVDHSAAMQILGSIVDILGLHDAAVDYADKLKKLFVQHHRYVMVLYGTQAIRVKTHLSYHIPESLQKWGVLLDCFSCERRNRLLKAACTHVQGHARVEKSIIERLVLDLVHNVCKSKCQPYCLMGVVSQQPALISEFRHLGNVSTVTIGKWLSTPCGAVKKGTVFAIKWSNGVKTVLVCEHCVDVRMLETISKPKTFVYAAIHVAGPAGVWYPAHGSAYFEATMISDVLSATRLQDGGICPIWRSLV
jgi:hypothetical protein